MRHTIFLTLILSTLALSADVVAGKNEKQAPRGKHLKQEKKEIQLLQRSTDLYWDGVRWNNAERSSAFIENPTTRMAFQQWLETRFSTQRVMNARVLRVDVGPPLGKDATEARKARITVAIEGYTLPEQVVKNETVVQLWYRSLTGWWLDWSPETTNESEENGQLLSDE